MKKLTTELFIDKCLLKHKDKYNYSMNGQGCDKCRIDNKKIGIGVLLQRCSLLHNDKYDYSLVSSDYKSVKDKIDVICKDHGVFVTSIKGHLYQKRGCMIVESWVWIILLESQMLFTMINMIIN